MKTQGLWKVFETSNGWYTPSPCHVTFTFHVVAFSGRTGGKRNGQPVNREPRNKPANKEQ